MSQVAKYQSEFYDPDKKQSMWRRNYPQWAFNDRTRYCADIDWIEWRKGKPVAAVETTRMKDRPLDKVVEMFRTRNKGFQQELVYTVASAYPIRSFIVIIEDPNWRDRDEDFRVCYKDTNFHVYEMLNNTDLRFMATCYGGEDYFKRFLVNFMDELRDDIRKVTGS
jgi:hypothetical protein